MFVEILNNFNLEEYSHKDSRHQFFRIDLYCKRVGIGIGSPTSENFTTPQNYFDFSVTANSQVYMI
jgi:hypothetical protein